MSSESETLELPISGDPQKMAALVAGVERIVAALGHMGQKTEETAKKQVSAWDAVIAKTKTASEAYVYIKSAIVDVVGTVVSATQRFAELAAAGERDATALERLGTAWQQVQKATRDTLTVTQAYAAQQTIVRSGLRLSGEELALITRYAREHGDVMSSTGERVERFTEALRQGEAGGLRQFGIAVQQGATRAQTFERALRQMRAATVDAEPSQRTLAEETSRFGESLTEGASAAANFVSHLIGLPSLLSDITAGVRSLTSQMRDLVEIEHDLPLQHAANAESNSANTSYTAATQELRRALNANGMSHVQIPVMTGGVSTETVSREAQRLRTLAASLGGGSSQLSAADIARRTSDLPVTPYHDSGFAGMDDMVRENGSPEERRRRLRAAVAGAAGELAAIAREQEGERTARNRAAQPGPRDTAATTSGHGRERIKSITDIDEKAWLLLRQTQDIVDAQRAAQRRLDAIIDGTSDTSAALSNAAGKADAVRAEAEAAYERTSNRSRRDAMTAGRAEAAHGRSAELEDLRDPGSQAERLEAMRGEAAVSRERRQLEDRYQMQRTFTERWEELHGRRVNVAQEGADAVNAATTSISNVFSEHLQAWVAGQEDVEDALQGFGAGILSSISKEAAAKGAFWFAEGLADLASPVTIPFAGQAFAASAAFFAVSAGLGFAGAKAAPSGGGAGAAPSAAPANNQHSSARDAPPSNVYQFYAPVFGGREGTEAEAGAHIDRYTRANQARMTRDRAA